MQSKSRQQLRVVLGRQNPKPNSTKPNSEAQIIVLPKGASLSAKNLAKLKKQKKENPGAYESAIRDMHKVYTKLIVHT